MSAIEEFIREYDSDAEYDAASQFGPIPIIDAGSLIGFTTLAECYGHPRVPDAAPLASETDLTQWLSLSSQYDVGESTPRRARALSGSATLFQPESSRRPILGQRTAAVFSTVRKCIQSDPDRFLRRTMYACVAIAIIGSLTATLQPGLFVLVPALMLLTWGMGSFLAFTFTGHHQRGARLGMLLAFGGAGVIAVFIVALME